MNPGTCRNDLCNAALSQMRSDAVWCSRACAMNQKRRDSANVGRTGLRRSPSGAQVSYFKAVTVLTEALSGVAVLGFDETWVREHLRQALPARQRARLEDSIR